MTAIALLSAAVAITSATGCAGEHASITNDTGASCVQPVSTAAASPSCHRQAETTPSRPFRDKRSATQDLATCSPLRRVDAYVYDERGACFSDERSYAFCQKSVITCIWEGDPVLLVTDAGKKLYLPSSCYDFPEGWAIESMPDGVPSCDDSE